MLFVALATLLAAGAKAQAPNAATLPESPGASRPQPEPCPVQQTSTSPEAAAANDARDACLPRVNPYTRFLNSTTPYKLTPSQKGYLAVRDVIDPFNILTIAANSAFTIGIDAHTAYGPGMRGFGRNVGYSFLQDATGEFIGTFLVCSLAREDPHYHRKPEARPARRLVHAMARTIIAQHDNGSLMPNIENFITYPASAEISNLYVPGVAVNAPSTAKRVMIGLATDPVNNIITEFLPDFAKHIHIRIVFVQQILNQVATNQQF